jgi:hypothetical protein
MKEKISRGLRRPKINDKTQQPTKSICAEEGKETMYESGGERGGRASTLFSRQLSLVDVKNKIK